MGRTVAVYQSPDAPSVLIIMDLPLRDSVRDFQSWRRFSSLMTWLSQLALSKLVLPKYTPRILSLSVTQVMFTGPVERPAEVPIHKPSVFCAVKREPEPCSKTRMMWNALLTEKIVSED